MSATKDMRGDYLGRANGLAAQLGALGESLDELLAQHAKLIAVAEAAGRLVAATNPLIDSDPFRERQAVSQALAALEAP